MACLTRPSLQQTSRASTKHFWVLSTCTLHRPPGDPENSSLNLTTHYFFCKNGISRRGRSAREECGPFIFMCRFMTCTLFVVAVVLLIFPPFLSPSSPATISNKPSWWPRLTHCRNERGPPCHTKEWMARGSLHSLLKQGNIVGRRGTTWSIYSTKLWTPHRAYAIEKGSLDITVFLLLEDLWMQTANLMH